MASDNSAPWSQWDAPGFQYVTTNTQPTIRRVFDPSSGNVYYGGVNNPVVKSAFVKRDAALSSSLKFFTQITSGGTLVDQRINSLDPSFTDCVYSIPNSAARIVDTCYKNIGCCEEGCCSNDTWTDEYGWAVALIVVFCLLVLIAVFLILCCWLRNRSRDKRQRSDLLKGAGFSPSQLTIDSQTPVAYTGAPAGYHY
ncbi:hypothetical protein PRIPAC_75721 [Pristionchus pacificus]|uniref:Uncharacterized protein n=1 Tax=Pristionchus pacificus TaxID=54126 RepID=A0A2A6BZA5_PRIPA|nr:hypothetical protein PRIPAC_75721 [Pristionchus pacificus]|eukprot:PDM71274.1 hypothetical protein PRIPAC_37681 [Pristionchus pacificus]